MGLVSLFIKVTDQRTEFSVPIPTQSARLFWLQDKYGFEGANLVLQFKLSVSGIHFSLDYRELCVRVNLCFPNAEQSKRCT